MTAPRMAAARTAGRLTRCSNASTPPRITADVAYTTVMTVLNRLCEQGFAARRRVGRAYAYTAVVDEAEVTARQMRRLLEGGPDRVAVLRRFLGVLSEEDERALVELVERIDEDGPR